MPYVTVMRPRENGPRLRLSTMFQESVPATPAPPCGVQSGAVCWRKHRSRIEVLLITSRDTGRWVIPKGWTISGLSPAESAAREAWEEAGVKGDVSDVSLGDFRYDKILSGATARPCQVQVFALHVSALSDRFPEHKQRRRKWFDAALAARKVQEPELRNLLATLPNLLGKKGRSDAALAPD